jgi:hypothetical protein
MRWGTKSFRRAAWFYDFFWTNYMHIHLQKLSWRNEGIVYCLAPATTRGFYSWIVISEWRYKWLWERKANRCNQLSNSQNKTCHTLWIQSQKSSMLISRPVLSEGSQKQGRLFLRSSAEKRKPKTPGIANTKSSKYYHQNQRKKLPTHGIEPWIFSWSGIRCSRWLAMAGEASKDFTHSETLYHYYKGN